MRALLLSAPLVALVLGGCSGKLAFECATDDQCVRGGTTGKCIAGGDSKLYCAFADSACPGSGARFDETAGGGLSGQCVSTSSGDMSVEAMPDLSMPQPDLAENPDLLTPELTWSPQNSGQNGDFWGVGGYDDQHVWAVGPNGIFFSGNAGKVWRQQPTPVDANAEYTAVFARPGKVFVTSWYGYLVVSSDDGQHWLSAQLPPEVSGFNLHSIWGSDAANVWAVGDNGIILHSVDMGATWVSQNSGTGEGLNSIWGVGPLELFAAGTTGTVVHTINGGRTWSTQSTGTSNDLYTIWGATRDNVIASGAAQLILQWTGTGWKTASKGTGDTMNDYFNGVWIDGRGNGYAVGNGGLIVHSTDAKTWTPQPSGTSGWLGGIWGPSAVSVFVVGEAGVILHGEP